MLLKYKLISKVAHKIRKEVIAYGYYPKGRFKVFHRSITCINPEIEHGTYVTELSLNYLCSRQFLHGYFISYQYLVVLPVDWIQQMKFVT